MTNRVIRQSEIRTVRVKVGSTAYMWGTDGGTNGRLRMYAPNGRDVLDLEVLEVEVEDTAPAYADALHKLAEQSERAVRLADEVKAARNRYDAVCLQMQEERAEHAEAREIWKQALADERATAAALQTELNAVRAELADRKSLTGAVENGRQLSAELCQVINALSSSRREYEERRRYEQNWPNYSNHTSDLATIRTELRDLKDIVAFQKARRQHRRIRKGK